MKRILERVKSFLVNEVSLKVCIKITSVIIMVL